ncbi:MAG TPA: magnesium chelatase domain-containing protein [Actinomycetota bacterium]|nr:magnesium chelatase domain-containing protein [Actinomycetota bacterium]
MLAATESVALIGTEAHLVQVEVDVSIGVPKLTFVGLPAISVREAEQRMRSALQSSGERWPPHRMVANLAPAALRKEGTHFDLPMAIGIVAADGRLEASALKGWVIVGELALDGSVRPVRGTLAAAISCRTEGRRGVICPAGNAGEAQLVDGIEIVPVSTLQQCLDFLRGKCAAPPFPPSTPITNDYIEDMRDVRGHARPKKALEIAAAGGHNVLL